MLGEDARPSAPASDPQPSHAGVGIDEVHELLSDLAGVNAAAGLPPLSEWARRISAPGDYWAAYCAGLSLKLFRQAGEQK